MVKAVTSYLLLIPASYLAYIGYMDYTLNKKKINPQRLY